MADGLIGAHELLHALGALPAGAPHSARGTTDTHAIEPDVLSPFTSGQPLAQLILDVNHDDYYGHSGSWIDIQDSAWLHLLGVPRSLLNVALAGAGR